jgi:microcystin-dependent protein
MSSPYVGQILLFGGNFAINGWALCNGQLLPISENETLFNLIGTTYGGDGQSTFGLPDLRGRVPVHMGQGPGISQNYQLGEAAGVEYVTLTTQQIASHNHAMMAVNTDGNANVPGTGNLLSNEGGADKDKVSIYAPWDNDPNNMTTLLPTSIAPNGGSQPHENRQQYLTLNFIISLFGVYPSPT